MVFSRDFFLLFLFLITLFGFMLGHRPLSAPDEGRYAEIPREMVVSGDYLTPRLNGIKYFEKPPLMYWMEAVSIKVFGLSEWSLRLLPAFLGIIGCLWLFIIARLLSGREEAWTSAVILGTCSLYYAHTRLLILDLGVTVFLSLTLFSFLMATRASSVSKQNKWLLGFYTGSALSVLTKGMIGAVIPGAIILLWTVPWKRWAELKLAFKGWGILLFSLIALPWHLLVSFKNPEFPYFYFIYEHFARFTTTAHGRAQGWWFFIPILVAGLFPWMTFLPQAIYHAPKNLAKEVMQFLGLWIGFIFIFFSLSQSKLIPYILPLFPPLCLILGLYIGRFWRENKNTLGFVWGVQTFQIVCGVLIVALPFILYTQDLLFIIKSQPVYLALFLIALLSGIFMAGFFVSRGKVKGTLMTITGVSVAIFIILNALWPTLAERSIKPLALALQKRHRPEDKIICYEKYYQELPVYLNQIVMVAEWRGELDFGMQQEDTTSWMISRQKFWEFWKSPHKVYGLMRKSTFENLRDQGYAMILIEETSKDVLVTNHP